MLLISWSNHKAFLNLSILSLGLSQNFVENASCGTEEFRKKPLTLKFFYFIVKIFSLLFYSQNFVEIASCVEIFGKTPWLSVRILSCKFYPYVNILSMRSDNIVIF